jgi:hypothetical protein
MKAIFALLLTLLSIGCGYGSSNNGGMMGGAAPSISTSTPFAPPGATAGGGAFVLTINGSNFSTSSVVYFNMTAHTAMYATAQQITANISAAEIASSGMKAVYVRSNNQNSNTVNFPVN